MNNKIGTKTPDTKGNDLINFDGKYGWKLKDFFEDEW
jgi:hypothetical protein